MTLDEAKALVLYEGMLTEPDFDDAVPLMLHQGNSPALERMSRLVEAIDTVHEAIDTVHEAIENETTIDRRIAGALWIIGVEASNALGKGWQPQEEAAIVALWEAVESTLVGFWPVGHPRDKDPRDKDKVTHGDSAA